MKFVKQMLGKYVSHVLTSAIDIKNGFGVPGNYNKFMNSVNIYWMCLFLPFTLVLFLFRRIFPLFTFIRFSFSRFWFNFRRGLPDRVLAAYNIAQLSGSFCGQLPTLFTRRDPGAMATNSTRWTRVYIFIIFILGFVVTFRAGALVWEPPSLWGTVTLFGFFIFMWIIWRTPNPFFRFTFVLL